MLPPEFVVAKMVVKRRRALKYSQRRVAAELGCNQSYIAQVETGRRPISRRMAEGLEVLLKVHPGSYTGKMVFRRGRRRRSPETRRALRLLRRAKGPARRRLVVHGRPSHPRPDLVHRLESPLSSAGGPWEVEQLQQLREKDAAFWRLSSLTRYDSKSEKRLHIRVGLTGAEMVMLTLDELECVLPSVNGKTGRASDQTPYPAFVWRWKDISLTLFPQRCVGTPSGHRWPDNLLIASRRGRKLTGVVEVDGDIHHQDRVAMQRRDEDLDIPVLHLPTSSLSKGDLMERIHAWAAELLASRG